MNNRALPSILIILMLVPILMQAQIPNGGFEEWEVQNGIETPLGWETNQTADRIRMVKDSLAMEGTYSLKIIPGSTTAWQDCVSRLTMSVDLDTLMGENKALTFYRKTVLDSLNVSGESFFRISIKLYVDDILDERVEWTSLDTTDVFEKIELPIGSSQANSLSIEIWGGASNGAADGCDNQSITWLDGLAIEVQESTSHFQKTKEENTITIYPNPSNGLVHIFTENDRLDRYFLYNLQGQVVQSGPFFNLLLIEEPGVYFVQFLDNEGKSTIAHQIIVQ